MLPFISGSMLDLLIYYTSISIRYTSDRLLHNILLHHITRARIQIGCDTLALHI